MQDTLAVLTDGRRIHVLTKKQIKNKKTDNIGQLLTAT